MAKEPFAAGQHIESLHERADELLGKLSKVSRLLEDIERKFESLPTSDQMNDLTAALPSASGLQGFADAWERLPSIDDLNEFTHSVPSAQDLRDFAEKWNSDSLPTIDELKEYADAASQIAAGLQAAE
jgi:hypothetical protein